jgi:predicted nucleotide-binding protein
VLSAVASDQYLDDLGEEARKVPILDEATAARTQFPHGGTYSTRDSLAISQGWWVAPHQLVLAEIMGIWSPFHSCANLASIVNKAADHLHRRDSYAEVATAQMPTSAGGRVFIGHGHSPLWREFKDFISERLGLLYDEFNHEPTPGVTTVARLSQMLDTAGIAFLLLTAEDERADGGLVARQNVVHESGLFQGRLGFARAIIVLEDGCEQFSNVDGLGQIRFAAGRISDCFEEVRRVLEREGFLPTA